MLNDHIMLFMLQLSRHVIDDPQDGNNSHSFKKFCFFFSSFLMRLSNKRGYTQKEEKVLIQRAFLLCMKVGFLIPNFKIYIKNFCLWRDLFTIKYIYIFHQKGKF